MKEVVKASISGIAFTFEQDAYKVINDYLDKLEAWYSKYPDGREIVADIEARVAELILERQESDKVIGLPLAEEIVGQMGYPDEMEAAGAEPLPGEFPRRFYRNPEGAKLAGICSGLGVYFKIDPIWLRLGIFAPLLLGMLTAPFDMFDGFWFSLFGFVVLLYFVLWIAVPMAKNPRQKLEMRGERVTANSIRQEFEQTADTISQELRQAAKSVGQEFRQAADSAKQRSRQTASSAGQAASSGRHASDAKSQRNASVLAEIVYTFGRIALVIAKIVLFFIAFIIGIVLFAVLAAIVTVALSLDISFWGMLSESIGGMVGISLTGFVIIWLVIIFIPLFILLYSLIKAIFEKRASRPFLITSWVIWLILLIWGAALTIRNAEVIRGGAREIIMKIEHGDLDDWIEDYFWLHDDRLDDIFDDDHFDYDYERFDNEQVLPDNNGTLPENGDGTGNLQETGIGVDSLNRNGSVAGSLPQDGTANISRQNNNAAEGSPQNGAVKGSQQESGTERQENDTEIVLIDGSIGSQRILRTDGGPITVEKSSGRKEAIIIPESTSPETESSETKLPADSANN